MNKPLYGLDDRLEEAQVTDTFMQQNGAATVAFVEADDLRFDGQSDAFRNRYRLWTLSHDHIAQGGLCPGER